MTKQELIDHLIQARSALTELIIDVAPKTPEERQVLKGLVARRDHLAALVNQLIGAAFTAVATAPAQKAIGELEKAAAELSAVQSTIEDARTALGLADAVLMAGVKVVGAVL